MNEFYILCDLAVIVYTIYSWYWQAMIETRAKYRYSGIVWVIIILIIGYSFNYFAQPTLITNVFIAAIITMSVIDGFSGFAKKRLVTAGYFKRTLKYSEIAQITLISVPTIGKPSVMAIFQTKTRQAYSLRFNKGVEEIIGILRHYVEPGTRIEVRQIM
ncbi:hypothetical protein FP435_07395 [Lactobacillus sp. PV037]|uniref:hypothetical protein n=1 Tax=unclassified Lactobacillus TaxID=2620435 RepID=UPI00223F3A08|nr:MULTISPECIES: hypothetical protein [unclassified Lactobacillus]QNQ81700.1 hypothetical protein FP433_00855 [Lactobacillus sp. PV012]QNQ84253.1 hypothetical protein FP435_07395 [Lactobacillus sp. PV037]